MYDATSANIDALIKESGIPPGTLFRQYPDLLDMLATQLARHIAKSDDDVPRLATEWKERLLSEFKERPVGASDEDARGQ